MSKESWAWLNTMVLIGHTLQRGSAWHYRASEQSVEPNHYEGAIPLEDVRRRLFNWSVLELIPGNQYELSDGSGTVFIRDRRWKAMGRPAGALGPDDMGAILGYFKKGYQGHDYNQWLLDAVANILDDDLNIGSAGLLREGAQAWVSVEVPETMETPEGVRFRPHLLATTSFDGSLATCYKRVVTNVVCDNTMAAGLAEQGQAYRVKHSRHSTMKLAEARDALKLVHTIADDFAAEVAQLTSEKVTNAEYRRFVEATVPLTKDGKPLKDRALDNAEKKREAFHKLWVSDGRVAPWTNTAWGVVQAANTYQHHIQGFRGEARAARNMALAVTGSFDVLDRKTYRTLQQVRG